MATIFLTAILAVLCFSLVKSSDDYKIFGFGETNQSTFFCRHPHAKTTPLSMKFPDVFSVAIEAVYYTDEANPRLSDVLQTVDQPGKLTAITRSESGVEYQYIFNGTSNTYTFINDLTTCSDGMAFRPFAISNVSQTDPLLFPSNVNEKWWGNVSSILDVWDWATNDPAVMYMDEEEHTHEHGIPIDHYYVCKKGARDEVIQVEISMARLGEKFSLPDFNISLPVRIDFKRYNNATAANVSAPIEEFVGYRLSGYKSILDSHHREKAFLPPVGVACNISSKTRPQFPTLPTTFSVAIEYFGANNQKIAVSQLHVDDGQHFVAFQFSSNDTGLPLTPQIDNVTLDRGQIVHDFHCGVEYVIDTAKDTCSNVSDLPNHAPDAVTEEGGKREIFIKSTNELLGLHFNSTAFYYVGERILDNNVPADVWIASDPEATGQKANHSTVYEAYFSKPNWQSFTGIGSAPKPVLLMLKTYEWPGVAKMPPTVQTLRYHDFTTYSKPGVPLKLFDVSPCLNISKNDSYLVAFSNVPLTTIDSSGRGNAEEALRTAIAKEAKVTPLRVTNFYFEAMNDTFWVFFVIAERPNVNGTKTKYTDMEMITVKEARENLNKSIMANDLSVTVQRGDGTSYSFALTKKSLSAVPPFFSPPVIRPDVKPGGYTGGSMAALGICMLIIGGVLGMVLAFFMWKRNRGIAYQIYE